MQILPMILFGGAAGYFGFGLLRIVPTLARLLAAMWSGQVKWPGPRVHDSSPSASMVRERLGTGYENLFSSFFWNTLSLTGAFGYLLLTSLISTGLLSGSIVIKSPGTMYFLAILAFAGGLLASKQALRRKGQVDILLFDRAQGVEPRAVDGHSARAVSAIEHPALGYKQLATETRRAFDLFYESVRCLQDGNKMRALTLYQEALDREPALHAIAIKTLSEALADCSSDHEGAICYWLGLHSEYSSNLREAAAWYERAAKAYGSIGYKKRESRARCNLGSVKMQMRDGSGMEEFERATVLNPHNGSAYLNIARTYYSFSYPDDPGYELALDAFANAVRADPEAYTPDVISSLRELGYNWKQEWEEIAKRAQSSDTNDT